MKLELALKDKEDHLILLKSKCHDDSSLEQLRGRNLTQAQKELKNLAVTI